MIRLIAAVDSQRGIATDSGIPWKLPGDTAYFREKTASGLIVMGRATYDEFAAPLHGGENYVLTARRPPCAAAFRPSPASSSSGRPIRTKTSGSSVAPPCTGRRLVRRTNCS